MKKLHLICNSHIDPIWLWEWEEGASAAVSTFRSAAVLADKFDYIFNHNEVTVYKWVLEYEPELFEKIQKLVGEGKWHVMGGWYLQPDCNMPKGESIVRQIMRGREFFSRNFGARPTVAMNVDPFGHSVGIVQIMKKCGYDSYLFCRPYPFESDLPGDKFTWRGPDDSEIKCFRASSGYLTLLGEAVPKIKQYIEGHADEEVGMFLWGVGNHGGGPSAHDLGEIERLQKESDVEIVHSTPEQFFKEAKGFETVVTTSLYPSMVGCYTSMSRIKQGHAGLENMLYSTEKMCAVAAANGLLPYPSEALKKAEEDLLNVEFHDVLPGSSIKTGGEQAGLQRINHGMEELGRLRAKAFFALSNGFEKVTEEAYPIFVFNPHPYEVKTTVECEFMLANQNFGDDFTFFTAYDGDTALPSQIIRESSNLNLDWRKRILFDCTLRPMSMNRIDCVPYRVEKKPVFPTLNEDFVFDCLHYSAVIDGKSGFIKSIKRGGREYLAGEAFVPEIFTDTDDPWGSSVEQSIRLGDKADQFALMPDGEGSAFSGLKKGTLHSLRIIEDGEVATIVEGLFFCRGSHIRTLYTLYKNRAYIEVSHKVFWNEKSMALKVAVPATCAEELVGEIPFGAEKLKTEGCEVPSQRWCALKDKTDALAIVKNGVYGASCEKGTLRLTLLRSPAYSALPIGGREDKLVPTDRFTDRMDQGEHDFTFGVLFGPCGEVLGNVSAEALVFAEKPYALNIYPSGMGKVAGSFLTVSDKAVVLSCLKYNDGGQILFRLYNSTEDFRSATVCVEGLEPVNIAFKKYEAKTFKIIDKTLSECEEMEI